MPISNHLRPPVGLFAATADLFSILLGLLYDHGAHLCSDAVDTSPDLLPNPKLYGLALFSELNSVIEWKQHLILEIIFALFEHTFNDIMFLSEKW